MAELKRMPTHLVLKHEKIEKALSKEEMESLFELVRKIKSRYGEQEYYICNLDEPYAQEVIETILAGEYKKAGKTPAEKTKYCPYLSNLVTVTMQPTGKIIKGMSPPVQYDSKLIRCPCMKEDCKLYNKETGKCSK